jgi:hypothetical protein
MRPASNHLVHALRFVAAALLVLAAVACTDGGGGGDDGIPQELADAITEAFPGLDAFELVSIDDAGIVADLRAHALGGEGGQVARQVRLPLYDADGVRTEADWLAYHVDVRQVAIDVPDSDDFDHLSPSGPSMTFRGVPDWSYEQTMAWLGIVAEGGFDPTVLQPSMLALIGDHLEGAHFGIGLNQNVTVIEHLGNALQPHFGTSRADELAALVAENYLVYIQSQYRGQLLHGEPHSALVAPSGVETAVADGAEPSVTPLIHTQVRELRPVMVADATVYDPSTNTWHISNWFDRVDAVANRQDANLWLSNIAADVPSWASDLPVNNNRILVRTRIAGYEALTLAGQTRLSYPAASKACGDTADTFINRIRLLSRDVIAFPNEYWMWWTREYGGGCAYIEALGETPHRGAVGWSGYGDGTHDWTSFVFMHESGHILGGTHRTNDGTSPETLPNHRCNLLGEIPFGPTGPSLMSYASGSFTFCFAASDTSGAQKRNLTQVAEYLNEHLK